MMVEEGSQSENDMDEMENLDESYKRYPEDTLKSKIFGAFGSYLMNLLTAKDKIKILNAMITFGVENKMEEIKGGNSQGQS